MYRLGEDACEPDHRRFNILHLICIDQGKFMVVKDDPTGREQPAARSSDPVAAAASARQRVRPRALCCDPRMPAIGARPSLPNAPATVSYLIT